jgi:hypothetical protein
LLLIESHQALFLVPLLLQLVFHIIEQALSKYTFIPILGMPTFL